MPTQYASCPSPRPFVQTASYLPRETDRPNLQQPMPIAPPAFMATSLPVYQPSDSKDKYSGQKTGKDKAQWDPIPITYIKLRSKLIESGFIELFYLAPLRPPFPRWYNANIRCDYHAGNSSHSIKNCIALKRTVQSLINEGKLNFEKSNEPAGVEDLFGAKKRLGKKKRPQGKQGPEKR